MADLDPLLTPEYHRLLTQMMERGSIGFMPVRCPENVSAEARAIAAALAEIDRLRTRTAQLESPDPIACAELLGIDPARRDITVRHWAVPLMARSFAEFLGDAPNYRSVCIDVIAGKLEEGERTRLEVIVRRAEGKTPSEKVTELQGEVERLRSAIREHRDQKADDRCIEDDDRLYAALGDGIPCDRRVGDKAAMLANCARFIERRCEGGGWPSYRELEEEVQRLRAERDQYQTLAAEMRRQRDDLECLHDALECLDRIGQMVGFGEANRGPDDRQRLVREVREALETLRDERDALLAWIAGPWPGGGWVARLPWRHEGYAGGVWSEGTAWWFETREAAEAAVLTAVTGRDDIAKAEGRTDAHT